MNSFLISIRPKFVAKIFNGDKTAEIRKTAPKDWKDYLSGKTKIKPEPKTGYIYCTKGEPFIQVFNELQHHGERFAPRCVLWKKEKLYPKYFPYGEYAKYFCSQCKADLMRNICNGKVVAKFTLREVKAICIAPFGELSDEEEMICSESCVPLQELVKYLRDGMFGYAWRISDLQIFDEPMELSDFYTKQFVYDKQTKLGVELHNRLDRAPQSWCYVESMK